MLGKCNSVVTKKKKKVASFSSVDYVAYTQSFVMDFVWKKFSKSWCWLSVLHGLAAVVTHTSFVFGKVWFYEAIFHPSKKLLPGRYVTLSTKRVLNIKKLR